MSSDALIQELYETEAPRLRKLAYQALSDWGLADTAVQETFVIALRNREKLAQSPSPVGWLYRTQQHVIQHLRRDQCLAQ